MSNTDLSRIGIFIEHETEFLLILFSNAKLFYLEIMTILESKNDFSVRLPLKNPVTWRGEFDELLVFATY